MTEVLPTPHSLTVATIISLYSNPHSSLYPNAEEEEIGWSTRLSRLIHQLVREGEGCLLDDYASDENDINVHSLWEDAIDDTAVTQRQYGDMTQLKTESLSTLLSRIDDAYTNDPTAIRSHKRTPPSQALLSKLQPATQSIEHLLTLVEEFHSLLEGHVTAARSHPNISIKVDGDSSFGVFLRQVCLGVEELSLESLSRLWVCLGGFVNACCASRSSSGGSGGDDSSEEWLPSSSQVERIVKQTCWNVDLNRILSDDKSCSHPHDNTTTNNDNKCSQINLLDTHPETPSLHFLLYHTSLLQKEQCATLESLHRYFDYKMIHERKERVERSLAGVTTQSAPLNTNTTGMITTSLTPEQRRTHPNNTTKIYKESNSMPYAAILLAFTHYRFHHTSLAIQATHEAIRIAQQSNETECVVFARAWLAYLTGESMRTCRDSAMHLGMKSLMEDVSLELGRREGYQRRRVEDGLEDVGTCVGWESIESAGRSVGTCGGGSGLITASSTSGHGVANFTDVDNRSSKEALSLLGRQHVALSGLWDCTGHSSMGSLSSCAALHGFGSNIPSEEGAAAIRRILASFSYGPGLDAWLSESSGREKNCCVYAASLDAMSSLHGRSSDLDWVQSTTSILHEWCVRSHDLNIARNLQCILANHAAFPSNPSAAVETALNSLSKSTHLHIQSGDFATAKIATRRACSLAAKHSMLIHQGWNLLQLALIDLEASTSAPSINPSVERSLPPLLECLHLAEKHTMDPLRAVALTVLARVLLCMGRFERARAMLNSALPLVMQHGHIWFQAEACLTLAKCNLTEAKQNDTKTNSRIPPIALQRTALSQLENSASLFNKIEDLHRLQQTYYLQAMVCNTIPGMQTKRDEFAKKFTQLASRKRVGSKMWNAVHGILVGDATQLRQ